MNQAIELFTIGFTQKSAKHFFELLVKSGVTRVIDTRLNNASQLAGFAKQKDLQYFLQTIGQIEYIHLLDLAPTKDILESYKKKQVDWDTYAENFNKLIAERQIENQVSADFLDKSCLLCSEAKPHHCHRLLVAEYLQQKLNTVIKIHHLE